MEDESIQPQPQKTNDPASALSTLLSDPTMLSKIGTVISALQGSGIGAPPPKTESAPAQESVSAIPTDGLSALLSDPTVIEKLPQIMAVLKPLLTPTTPPKTEEAEPSQPTSVLIRSHTADRDNLLLAIKPFLSSGRSCGWKSSEIF